MWSNPQGPFTEEILNGKLHFLCRRAFWKKQKKLSKMLQFLKKLKLHAQLVFETVRSILISTFICDYLYITIMYKSIFITGAWHLTTASSWKSLFGITLSKNKNALFQNALTAQKMKFSIKDFFGKCDQIRSFIMKIIIWYYFI